MEFLHNLRRNISLSKQNLSNVSYSIFDPCIVDNESKKLQNVMRNVNDWFYQIPKSPKSCSFFLKMLNLITIKRKWHIERRFKFLTARSFNEHTTPILCTLQTFNTWNEIVYVNINFMAEQKKLQIPNNFYILKL